MKYYKQEKFAPLQGSSQLFKHKTVAIIGVGGLGSHSAEYMVRMGMGTVILVDDDVIEVSNLPRQGIYTQFDSDENLLKAEVAAEQLQKVNPDVTVIAKVIRLRDNNIDEILRNVDLVLDGTDNLKTRYLLNDYCFQNNIPWIYGSATSSMGTVTSFIPGQTPCFRCVYGNHESEDNASCDVNGVILPALTVTASLQVTEAIKILAGTKNVLVEEIRYNVWTREESSVDIRIFEDKECLCKKDTHNKTNAEKHNQAIYILCSGDSVQVNHTYSEKEVTSLFLNSGYLLNTRNPVFKEFKKRNGKRAVAFNTGKIVFHHTGKDEVERLLKKEN